MVRRSLSNFRLRKKKPGFHQVLLLKPQRSVRTEPKPQSAVGTTSYSSGCLPVRRTKISSYLASVFFTTSAGISGPG